MNLKLRLPVVHDSKCGLLGEHIQELKSVFMNNFVTIYKKLVCLGSSLNNY